MNAPGRRYCRECGARLGQPCAVCHFFNAIEDKHCGGCGRRLKAAGALADAELAGGTRIADLAGGADLLAPEPAGAAAGISGQGVSQSEIDGLFENILDDEPEDAAGGGA